MEAQLTGRMLPFPQSSLVYFSPSGRAADMEHDMAVHGASPRLSSPSMAPSVRIVQMDPSTLHTGHLPSLTNVLRTLKRQESSLFNCLASCLSDADVVQQLVALYPSLPTYANLRCGLWYVRHPHGTCYFKSTDGHNGNWSFSTIRLNLAVAEEAALRGGCLIVDATRRGKTFPDALTKTVPIWAAVLNRAARRLLGQQQQQGQQPGQLQQDLQPASRCRNGVDGTACQLAAWDEDVHLPPWTSDNEKHQIRLRLDGWVDQLLQMGVDLSPLLGTLRKPLRCIWLSQESRIWTDQVVDISQLSFTPLVLISASLPNARERRQLVLNASPEPLHVVFDYVPGAGDDEESWAHGLTPTLMWRHQRELLAAGLDGAPAVVARLLAGQQEGAESGPVTPQGPGGLLAGGQLQQQESGQGQGGLLPAPVKAKWRAARRALPGGEGQHCLAPQGCRPGDKQPLPAVTAAAAADQPAPATSAAKGDALGGANGDTETIAGGTLGENGSGDTHSRLCYIGGTGLAVGPLSSGAPPGVWVHVDAVLNVGLWEHPGMSSKRLQQPAASNTDAGHAGQRPLHQAVPQPLLGGVAALPVAKLPAGSDAVVLAAARQKGDAAAATATPVPGCWQHPLCGGGMQPAAVASARSMPWMTPGEANLSAEPEATTALKRGHAVPTAPALPTPASSEPAGTAGGTVPTPACAAATGAPPGRYMWLPVPHSKFERQGLRAALPQALAFVSSHLQAGRRVLIHCDDGTDISVCTALAVLLACFRLAEKPQAESRSGQVALEGPGAKSAPGTPQRPVLWYCQPFSRDPGTGAPMPAALGFGKLTVRQYLAVLSGYCPQARPTRGMLKQVFNFFGDGVR